MGEQPVIEFVAVGHVTCDILREGTMAGGAAFFAARAAQGLGLRAGALSSFGPGFAFRSELGGIDLERVPADASTCFENRYRDGRRSQRLASLAAPLGPTDLPARLAGARLAYLCPVMGEVDLAFARAMPEALLGLGAQGWMRRADASGRIQPKRWRPTAEQLVGVDLVILSDEDAAADPAVVPYLAERVRLVAYTHGADGCELFVAGERHHVPAFPTQQLGPTGAGDVFGAAMLVGLSRGLEPLGAAQLASCAASIVVEAPGGGALDRIAECWDRLARYGELHGVRVPGRPAKW